MSTMSTKAVSGPMRGAPPAYDDVISPEERFARLRTADVAKRVTFRPDDVKGGARAIAPHRVVSASSSSEELTALVLLPSAGVTRVASDSSLGRASIHSLLAMPSPVPRPHTPPHLRLGYAYNPEAIESDSLHSKACPENTQRLTAHFFPDVMKTISQGRFHSALVKVDHVDDPEKRVEALLAIARCAFKNASANEKNPIEYDKWDRAAWESLNEAFKFAEDKRLEAGKVRALEAACLALYNEHTPEGMKI